MKLKKVLAATLAATMVMSSAMTVSASYYDSSSSSSSSESGSSAAAEDVVTADAPIEVAGVAIKTTVAGAYAAKSVRGTAVITPLAQVKASLGLKDGQVPAITIYDTDPLKSPKALACINAAADALGAEVLTTLSVDLGAKENGKWVTLSNGSVALTAGLPKNADLTKVYSAVCVQPGGIVTVFEDQDTDPATVTFEVKAGIGAYAIVAQ